MGDVILLDRELEVLRRVRKDGVSWLPAADHGVFKRGFDMWMSRHSEEAKRLLAREFMKMPLPTAKDTINRLLTIFKEWEASEKEQLRGKMVDTPDGSGVERQPNSALPGVGASGS